MRCDRAARCTARPTRRTTRRRCWTRCARIHNCPLCTMASLPVRPGGRSPCTSAARSPPAGPSSTWSSAVTLADRVVEGAGPDEVYEAFEGWAGAMGLRLYEHQEEALIELVSGANVILSTPTGSGKSLVATGAHFAALSAGQRTFYTAPIKALVSEKFFALCDAFGPASVGMLT